MRIFYRIWFKILMIVICIASGVLMVCCGGFSVFASYYGLNVASQSALQMKVDDKIARNYAVALMSDIPDNDHATQSLRVDKIDREAFSRTVRSLDIRNMEYQIVKSRAANPSDMTKKNTSTIYETTGYNGNYSGYIQALPGDSYDFSDEDSSLLSVLRTDATVYPPDNMKAQKSSEGNIRYYLMYSVSHAMREKKGSDLFSEAGYLVRSTYRFTSLSVFLTLIFALIFFISFILAMVTAGHRKTDLKPKYNEQYDTVYGVAIIPAEGENDRMDAGGPENNPAEGETTGKKKVHLRAMDHFPLEIYTILVLIVITAGYGLFYNIVTGAYYSLQIRDVASLVIAVLSVVGLVGLAYCMSVAVRIKAGVLTRYTICHYIAEGARRMWRAFRENIPLHRRAFLIFIGITLLELIVLAVGFYADLPRIVLALFLIYKILEIPFLMWVVAQMNRIRQGNARIADGILDQPIQTKGMFWTFKKHAQDINRASEGMAKAVEAKMRSERFRTELITNVSHDIKTPLTSIISYVDLLRREKIDNPQAQEYLDVLARQSSRMKKLIEDLIEASKVSSGNVKLHMEPCDISVMLEQTIGELQGKLDASGLKTVISEKRISDQTGGEEKPLEIMADGRQLWRVFDNILNNACKYAMPGTRLYIDVTEGEYRIRISFKNISRDELNISPDELMQRFTRGDSSRHTEGSGLGLSITSSLTRLMNGKMDLSIDGDMFQVNLSFPKLKEETGQTPEEAKEENPLADK